MNENLDFSIFFSSYFSEELSKSLFFRSRAYAISMFLCIEEQRTTYHFAYVIIEHSSN